MLAYYTDADEPFTVPNTPSNNMPIPCES